MMNSSIKINLIDKLLNEIDKSESLQGISKYYFIVINVECLINSKKHSYKLNEFHHVQDTVNLDQL